MNTCTDHISIETTHGSHQLYHSLCIGYTMRHRSIIDLHNQGFDYKPQITATMVELKKHTTMLYPCSQAPPKLIKGGVCGF